MKSYYQNPIIIVLPDIRHPSNRQDRKKYAYIAVSEDKVCGSVNIYRFISAMSKRNGWININGSIIDAWEPVVERVKVILKEQK